MDTRKINLLKLIIEQYIDTAEPVGSRFLVEEAGLEVSGATVRNEMRDLEEAGFLTHPHTSAGRIPTEVGYRYYVENMMKPSAIKKSEARELDNIAKKEKDMTGAAKLIAKFTAEQNDAAVIIAFGVDSVYYTGISNLFDQPEFRDHAQTINLSSIFDHCEEYINKVYDAIAEGQGVQIFIGQENPLGAGCSLTVSSLPNHTLFAMMTPLRTDYARNVGLAEYISELF